MVDVPGLKRFGVGLIPKSVGQRISSSQVLWEKRIQVTDGYSSDERTTRIMHWSKTLDLSASSLVVTGIMPRWLSPNGTNLNHESIRNEDL